MLRDVRCAVALAKFPGSGRLRWLRTHRARCLPCQAEQARRRKLQRQMHDLAEVTVPAPTGLATDVVYRLDRHRIEAVRREGSDSTGWMVAAAAAAGCAMALALARRALSAV